MKILRREIKQDTETFAPVVEVLVQLPIDLVSDEIGQEANPALAAMFRDLLTKPVESEKNLVFAAPFSYPELEPIDEVLEDYGVGSYEEWVMMVEEQQRLSDEENFGRTEDFLTYELKDVQKFMLLPSVILDNKTESQTQYLVNKDDLEEAISSLKMVYLVSKFGILDTEKNEYVETYKIQGVR